MYARVVTTIGGIELVISSLPRETIKTKGALCTSRIYRDQTYVREKTTNKNEKASFYWYSNEIAVFLCDTNCKITCCKESLLIDEFCFCFLVLFDEVFALVFVFSVKKQLTLQEIVVRVNY